MGGLAISALVTHELKVAPPYMDALIDGRKTFEVRRNDRAFQAGDLLRLVEADPAKCSPTCSTCSRPKNRAIAAQVTYVFSGDLRWQMLQPGHVVLGLRLIGVLDDAAQVGS